jgi:diguanylate cyclase (GGDEF)-like protein
VKIDNAFLRSRVARRIVILFVLSALVPVATLAALSYDHIRRLLVEQGYTQLGQVSETVATTLFERLLAVDRQMRRISADVTIGAAIVRHEMAEGLETPFEAIAVTDADAVTTTLLGSQPALPMLTDAERARLAKGATVLRADGPVGAGMAMYVARAIAPGRPAAGMLVGRIRPEYLWGDTSDAAPNTDVCVLSEVGALLFCSRPEMPRALRDLIDHLPNNGAGRFDLLNEGERELGSYRELFLEPRFLIPGWTVIATSPERAILAPMASFEKVFVPAMVLSCLVVALLSLTQVRRTLIPLERLIAGTRRVADQDFSARVDVRVDDEFGELATSFNAMIGRLGAQFTALQTLADVDRAILSRLDVDRIVETIVLRIRAIVPAEQVSIAIVDRNAPGAMRIYTRDQRNGGGVDIERRAVADADTGELLAHTAGLWIDPSAPVKPYTASVVERGAAAIFVLPIIWEQAVVGTVVLGFPEQLALTDEERGHARDLGDRIGVAFAAAAKDEQLYYQAHYDSLTGLPNRLYFKDQLGHAVAQAHRDRQRFAVLFIDIDQFKRVNDSLGHAAGDEVLREAAQRLRGCVRDADIVARLAGDEFTMILTDLKTSRDPQVVAEHVMAAMATPFVTSGHEHFLNASVGIAVYPADGANAEELLRNADTAMYRAKESGRGRAVYFEEAMNAAAVARVRSERDLHHAIQRGEFLLHYQPQLDLQTGRISGAEALLRWRHPERGLVSPDQFIQLAEDTGLIEPLGDWVLREACAQLCRWQSEGIALPRIAVNVSVRQFRQKGFIDKVARIIGESGVPASAVEIEITESLLLDAASTVEAMLADLKAVGVRLALDDFGTGYSSLAYLKRFPVDIVKIDRAFVKDLPADEGSMAITEAIIGMAHALRKQVVAEGVATADQLRVMRRLHCDFIQGYHLSIPLDAPGFAALMRQREGYPALVKVARA